MLNLMRLHWTANRRILFQMLPLFAFWGYAGTRAFQFRGPSAIHAISLLVGCTLCAVPMLQGLGSPVESFLLALPVDRGRFVSTTYLVGLLALLLGILLPVLIMAGIPAAPPVAAEIWKITALLLGMTATGLFLFLPLRFALAGTKCVSIFAASQVGAMILLWVVFGYEGAVDRFASAVSACMEHPAWSVPGVLILGIASHTLSRWAFGRRRF